MIKSLRAKAKVRLGTCNVWRFSIKLQILHIFMVYVTHHRNDVLRTDEL